MSDFVELLVIFLVGLAIYTASLWIAAKLIGDEGKFLEFGIIALISSLVQFIPAIGGIASLIVFFVLLSKLMDIDLFKALIITVLAFVIRLGALMLIFELTSTEDVGAISPPAMESRALALHDPELIVESAKRQR